MAPERDAQRDAMDQAMRLLARREYSRLELRRRLLERGHDDAVVEACLDRLIELELQSDQRFAEAFVRSRRNRGQGPVKIRADLAARGIRGDAAQAVLVSAFDDSDADGGDDTPGGVDGALRAAWHKRFGAPPADARDWARQARFLAGRGFPSDAVRRLLDSVGGSTGPDACA